MTIRSHSQLDAVHNPSSELSKTAEEQLPESSDRSARLHTAFEGTSD
jgi:hypothetical protein